MRKNCLKISLLTVGALFAFTSCVKEALLNGDAQKVTFYANVLNVKEDTDVDTKGGPSSTSGIVDESSADPIPAAIFRTDQNKDVYYPSFRNSTALPATLSTPDAANGFVRDIHFNVAQFYRNNNDNITFCGVSPWNSDVQTSNASGGTTLSYPINGSTDIMYGTPVEGNAKTGFPTMEFNHALCQFQIYVYAMVGKKPMINPETGEYIYDENNNPVMVEYNTAEDWGALTNMSIKGMQDLCTMTLPNDANDQKFVIDYSSSATDGTAFNFGDENELFFDPGELQLGIENAKKTAICVAAPPKSGVLKVTVDTEKATSQREVSIAKNFKPGYAYKIYLRFSDHGFINASVQVADWLNGGNYNQEQGVAMYYDLSRYGTSNSYIINSGNYNYSFNGTVKGNGVLPPNMSGDTKLDPQYLDILWTDFDNTDNFVSLQSHYLSNGLVMVQVGGDTAHKTDHSLKKEGNVVIAAYSQDHKDNPNDKYSDIIWTWHLWLSNNYVTDQGFGNQYAIQDRNLGAKKVSSNNQSEMEGLYYQWGRPTPLRSSGLTSSESLASSIEEAIASPNTLYGKTSENWLAADSQQNTSSIWGYTNDFTEIPKTLYDPCPLGYMVSNEEVWANAASYETSFNGSSYVRLTVNSNEIYFPTNGYISRTGNRTNSSQSYIWGATSRGADTAEDFRYTATKTASNVTSSRRSNAKQVRCVAEAKKELMVKDLSEAQTANCYIVSKEGYYKFNVGVRGNGTSTLIPVGGTTAWNIWDPSVGPNINTKNVIIKMLWWQGDLAETGWYSNSATSANLESNYIGISLLNDGAPDDKGYITFKVGSFHKGNLILAAVDKDNGTIQWSWHIWLTDKPVDKKNGNYVLMDRNLGATYAPTINNNNVSFNNDNLRWASFGFLYQWGRKDPIVGGPVSATYNKTKDTSSSAWWDKSSGSWIKKVNIETANKTTLLSTAQNPTKFYKGTGADTDANASSEWFNDPLMNHNNNSLNVAALWGYAVSGTNVGKSFSKTLFDPCPPGYRTMYHYAIYTNNTDGGGGTEKVTNEYKGNGFIAMKTGYEAAWWPLPGYRSVSGNLSSINREARYWTGMPYQVYHTRSAAILYNNDTSRKVGQVVNMGKAVGMSVRCQKE